MDPFCILFFSCILTLVSSECLDSGGKCPLDRVRVLVVIPQHEPESTQYRNVVKNIGNGANVSFDIVGAETEFQLSVSMANSAGVAPPICAIISVLRTTTTMRIMEFGDMIDAPVIGSEASSMSLSSPNFFRLCPDDGQQLQTLAKLIRYFGWKQAALLHSNGWYGSELPKIQNFPEGIRYTASVSFDSNMPDSIPKAADQVQSTNPNIVVVMANWMDTIKILNHFTSRQFFPVIIGTDAVVSSEVQRWLDENDGDQFLGYFGLRFSMPDNYKDPYWAAYLTDAVNIVRGSANCKVLQDKLPNTSYDGLTGHIEFIGSDRTENYGYDIVQYYNGSFIKAGWGNSSGVRIDKVYWAPEGKPPDAPNHTCSQSCVSSRQGFTYTLSVPSDPSWSTFRSGVIDAANNLRVQIKESNDLPTNTNNGVIVGLPSQWKDNPYKVSHIVNDPICATPSLFSENKVPGACTSPASVVQALVSGIAADARLVLVDPKSDSNRYNTLIQNMSSILTAQGRTVVLKSIQSLNDIQATDVVVCPANLYSSLGQVAGKVVALGRSKEADDALSKQLIYGILDLQEFFSGYIAMLNLLLWTVYRLVLVLDWIQLNPTLYKTMPSNPNYVTPNIKQIPYIIHWGIRCVPNDVNVAPICQRKNGCACPEYCCENNPGFWSRYLRGILQSSHDSPIPIARHQVLAITQQPTQPQRTALLQTQYANTPAIVYHNYNPAQEAVIRQRAAAGQFTWVSNVGRNVVDLKLPRVAYVGQDDAIMGQSVAEYFKNIGVMNAVVFKTSAATPGSASAIRMDAFKSYCVKNSMYCTEFLIPDDPVKFNQDAYDFFRKDLSIKGVFILTYGWLKTLRTVLSQIGLQGQVTVAQSDMDDVGIECLQTGCAHLLAYQQDMLQTYLSSQYVVLGLRGADFNTTYFPTSVLATKKDVDFLVCSSALQECVSPPCLQGTYYDGKLCQKCPAGTFVISARPMSIDSCLPCPGGFRQPKLGSFTPTDCLPCGSGQFSKAGSSVCSNCTDSKCPPISSTDSLLNPSITFESVDLASFPAPNLFIPYFTIIGSIVVVIATVATIALVKMCPKYSERLADADAVTPVSEMDMRMEDVEEKLDMLKGSKKYRPSEIGFILTVIVGVITLVLVSLYAEFQIKDTTVLDTTIPISESEDRFFDISFQLLILGYNQMCSTDQIVITCPVTGCGNWNVSSPSDGQCLLSWSDKLPSHDAAVTFNFSGWQSMAYAQAIYWKLVTPSHIGDNQVMTRIGTLKPSNANNVFRGINPTGIVMQLYVSHLQDELDKVNQYGAYQAYSLSMPGASEVNPSDAKAFHDAKAGFSIQVGLKWSNFMYETTRRKTNDAVAVIGGVVGIMGTVPQFFLGVGIILVFFYEFKKRAAYMKEKRRQKGLGDLKKPLVENQSAESEAHL